MKSSLQSLNSLRPFFRGRLPGQLIIQYSNCCNADCPQCGMRRSANIQRHTLGKEIVMRLIDSAAKKGIKALSFTGGEPLLFLDDIIQLIHHASAAGIPYIRTGTNGFLFRDSDTPGYEKKITTLVEKLAATDIYTFWISLDSAEPANHEAMRGLKGVVKGIEKALPIFHDHGIYPAVNLGINRATGGRSHQVFLHDSDTSDELFLEAFKASFVRFYSFVHNLGFTTVNACYPMSSDSAVAESDGSGGSLDTGLYGAVSSDSLVSFSPAEKTLIFTALMETIPKFRGKLRIFTPRCSLHNLIRKFADQKQSLYPCRGGTDFFFVNCDNGRVHPCGYRDEPLDELPELGQRQRNGASCELCEWECFRDPSDLLGPFAELFSRPHRLLAQFARDPKFYKLLQQDLRYYRACDFFNGRLAPRLTAMKRYEK
ncbi:MAG: radical SAM protein [Desulforhopalus sp.]